MRNSGKKQDLLLGFHSIYEALQAGKRDFKELLIAHKRSPGRLKKIISLAESKKIQIRSIGSDKLDQMADGANHQGIVARTSAYPFQKASQVADLVKNRQTPCFILVLENIEDPHNMGALIRTALCSGVDYILIPKDRSAAPSAAVSRSSAGAMEHADIFMITNTASVLRDLKAVGVWVSGLDGDGDTSLFNADLTGHIALVIGGEHKGVRPGVKKECDFVLSIPNKGKINSLNASVAGGIAMYEAMRQRSIVK